MFSFVVLVVSTAGQMAMQTERKRLTTYCIKKEHNVIVAILPDRNSFCPEKYVLL